MLRNTDKQHQQEHVKALTIIFRLAIITIISMVLFMTIGVVGDWSFIIPFRAGKLLVLTVVSCAIAMSTVVFQSLTHNNILTPSIIGFDKLYILIQTLIAFFFSKSYISLANSNWVFFINVIVMTTLSSLLFHWLFLSQKRSLHVVLLVGIILGSFFSSLNVFMQRILEPDLFAVLQDNSFANFNNYKMSLVYLAALAVILMAILLWYKLPELDVLSLGRNNAINLGMDYSLTMFQFLIIVNILVVFSTALVGPVTFFGLIVVHLARIIIKTSKHKYLLPAACLIAIMTLVIGQIILERIFNFNTALSIIVEFIGGLLFLFLLFKESKIKH
ncbi:iron chelate uptake ABC transporter family permease subunit [Bartonella sp. DGB1]|uniref:iron chelate uptake ABC transporter family permease subunit n=1 Tax=Bartonella sp. DGB1 TaxID=3239807 RepID=UPI00352497CE